VPLEGFLGGKWSGPYQVSEMKSRLKGVIERRNEVPGSRAQGFFQLIEIAVIALSFPNIRPFYVQGVYWARTQGRFCK
jgi:hypothetical protein